MHKDGRIEKCTLNEFIKKYSYNQPNITALIIGRQKSAYGWRVA
jgi:hypothetical protein